VEVGEFKAQKDLNFHSFYLENDRSFQILTVRSFLLAKSIIFRYPNCAAKKRQQILKFQRPFAHRATPNVVHLEK
jgi:hypothetical protein